MRMRPVKNSVRFPVDLDRTPTYDYLLLENETRFFMKGNDRYLWLGVGMGFIILILAVSFAPTVLAQSDSKDTEAHLRALEDVFRFIQNNYVEEVDPKQLLEGAMAGMFETLDDPYSYYLDENDLSSLNDTTSGNFGGVGLIISKEDVSEDEDREPFVEVVTPIEGTPAFRAGISAGDLITAVEGDTTENLSLDEVVDRLRGIPGTTVGVTILRGSSTKFDVEILRDIIEVPTVKYAMIGGDIGYIRIAQFTPFTDDRVKDAVYELELSGYDALIVDLRNNPGGLLTSVIDTADLFLAGKTIVSTQSRIKRKNEIFTARESIIVPSSVPIVVLINKGSASASEILAGALRDNDRAILVGETSYGKGSVQEVRDLTTGGFKLTTSRYYTPSGKNIDETGIEPDHIVTEPELTDAQKEALSLLTEKRSVELFVGDNELPSDSLIDEFIDSLQSDGIALEDRIIQRLIRNEMNRTNNNPPVYDLEYDLVLQEAVQILTTGGLAAGE